MKAKLLFLFMGFFLVTGTILWGEESEKPESRLKVVLQMDKMIHRLRDPIPMELRGTNQNKTEPIRLGFSSAQEYDFVITKEGKEIWRWSTGKVFAMMMDEIVLQPGQSLRFAETWDQKESQGEFVSPGEYQVVGVLKSVPEIVSEAVMIEMKADGKPS